MTPREIVAALKAALVKVRVIDGAKIALEAPHEPEPELLDAVKQNKPGVLALLIGPRDLFKRPAVRPGVPLVRDERDRSPNARLLSKEAREAGVSIPTQGGGRGGRLF